MFVNWDDPTCLTGLLGGQSHKVWMSAPRAAGTDGRHNPATSPYISTPAPCSQVRCRVGPLLSPLPLTHRPGPWQSLWPRFSCL